MAKVKDGFLKQLGSSEGSDSYVLLAGGGHKLLSEFALASDYLAKIGGTLTGALTVDLGAAAASPLALKSSGVTTTMGSLNGSWFHMGTTATSGFYFYQNVQSAGTMTATSFIGNATSATILKSVNVTSSSNSV